LALAGCSFDNGGLPMRDASGTVPDAPRFDAAVAFDAGDDIDAPPGAIDASTFDATPTAFDAQVFDATPPDDAPCMCDDMIDCTDDQCTMMGCSSVDICPGTSTCNMTSGLCDGVLSFQQDVGGYLGTRDTFLSEGSPDAINGALQTLEWDADEPFNSGMITASFLLFREIFGSAADQVPNNATINSATLTVTILNGSNGVAGEVREILGSWGESSTTWNNFGVAAGIQASEVGPIIAAAPLDTCNPCMNVTENVDVQASVQAWSLGQSTMRGWAFMPLDSDGIDIASSEAVSIDARPLLTVDFSAPAP
jgi:hypothetical protein